MTRIHSFRRILLSCLLTIFSLWVAFDVSAQCQPAGCPPFSDLGYSFPKNTSVSVVFPSNLPYPIYVALDNAINRVNSQSGSNGSGTTFSVVYSSPGSGPVINLTVDQTSTTTQPPCQPGNLACIEPAGYGFIQNANIWLGLGIEVWPGQPRIAWNFRNSRSAASPTS